MSLSSILNWRIINIDSRFWRARIWYSGDGQSTSSRSREEGDLPEVLVGLQTPRRDDLWCFLWPLNTPFSWQDKGNASSVQLLSRVWLFEIPRTEALQASMSITKSRSLVKLMSIESVMPSNHLNLCCPLLLLPSIFPSIKAFSDESFLCSRWPKYWSFSFNISPSNQYSGLISFRMDWLDLLAVQGTLNSLLQHHSTKASVF